jgi:hypothetical protein
MSLKRARLIQKETYRLNGLANGSCSCNLLGIRRGINECRSKGLDCQLPNSCANAQSFNPVSPKILVTEERLNDCRDTGCWV